MASKRYWEMLDTAHPKYVEDVVTLANWSLNYDYPTPMTLFLDLIGWSESELGETLCGKKQPALDYMSADYLGKALVEYSNKPHEVYEWVSWLLEEEGK